MAHFDAILPRTPPLCPCIVIQVSRSAYHKSQVGPRTRCALYLFSSRRCCKLSDSTSHREGILVLYLVKMLFKNILAVATSFVALSVAAPIAGETVRTPSDGYLLITVAPTEHNAGVAERGENSIYGTAHALKMADDEYKKRGENSIYGTAHALKMADDEYKKRGENSIYGTAHALKMADDEFKA
jgi:hypothetical protein